MTDAQLLTYALRLPTSSPYSAVRNINPVGRSYPGGGYDPGEAVVMTDPQQLATRLGALRQVVEQNQNPYNGIVIGDTPGGAQSALLNLRAQNIQIEQENARRAEAARQADLNRQLQLQIESARSRLNNTELMDRLLNSQADRALRQQQMQANTILGQGNILAKLAESAARSAPVDMTPINQLLGIGRQIDQQSAGVNNDINALLAQIQPRAEAAARANGLMVNYGEDGLPQFRFLNNADPSNATKYYAAMDSTYNIPATPIPGDWENRTAPIDLRTQYNNLLNRQMQLDQGARNYADDLKVALQTRNDRRSSGADAAVTDIYNRIAQALQSLNQPAQVAPLQSAAAQLLAQRGNVVGSGTSYRRPTPPAPKRWVMNNGAFTRN